MRKLLGVLAAGLILAAVSAAPALAQKDPFAPVVDLTPDEQQQPDVPGQPQVEPEPEPVPPPSQVLSNTGANVETWIAVAYMLIVAGAGAYFLARVMDMKPRPVRRR